MLNRSASLAMSTSVLKALPGKLDIKRHSPSILYLFQISDEPLPCTIHGQEVESGKYIYDTDGCNKCFCRNGEHMCEDRKVKCGPPG